MEQSPLSSSNNSGYSSPSLHFSSCPYANQSFYIFSPPPIYQPLINSTPISLTQVNLLSLHKKKVCKSFICIRILIVHHSIL